MCVRLGERTVCVSLRTDAIIIRRELTGIARGPTSAADNTTPRYHLLQVNFNCHPANKLKDVT